MWSAPLSSSLSHLAGKCGDKGIGIDPLASCALHIGALDLLSRDHVQILKGVHEEYVRRIIDLTPTTIHLVGSLLKTNPERHSLSLRTVVIPFQVEESMKSLAGILGLACDQTASLCIAHTLTSQPNKNVNKRSRTQIEEPVRALRVWLRFKARMLQGAIGELEGYSLDDEKEA